MIPAILGGRVSHEILPISRPTLPDFAAYAKELEGIFATGQITNGRWVRKLEEEAARYLGVRDVVAVSSATSGMMLVAKLLGLGGRVLLPSFTFPATLHVLLWNQIEPILVDCDGESFNIDPTEVEARNLPDATAVVPVYIFGNAPDWEALCPQIDRLKLRCFSDAAHAFGTRVGGRHAGAFGDAEVFSLAPTKVTVAGEGGLIATQNEALARDLRTARNYGNPGDYDCEMPGLNARQSEFHALLGVMNLAAIEANITRRHRLVSSYVDGLRQVPGVGFQAIADDCRSTHNYFAIRIQAEAFGLSNKELRIALDADRIESKIYFYPPLHRQSRFAHLRWMQGEFPRTEKLCAEVLCLPLFSHMRDPDVERVVEAIDGCQRRAPEIRAVLASRTADV